MNQRTKTILAVVVIVAIVAIVLHRQRAAAGGQHPAVSVGE